jgi:hypothetical protein
MNYTDSEQSDSDIDVDSDETLRTVEQIYIDTINTINDEPDRKSEIIDEGRKKINDLDIRITFGSASIFDNRYFNVVNPMCWCQAYNNPNNEDIININGIDYIIIGTGLLTFEMIMIDNE